MSTARKTPGPDPHGKRSSDDFIKKAFYIRKDQDLALEAAKFFGVGIHGSDRSEILVALLDDAGYHSGEDTPVLLRAYETGNYDKSIAPDGWVPRALAKERKLYHADNLTILPDLESGSVDLVYLDPPYEPENGFFPYVSTSTRESDEILRALEENAPEMARVIEGIRQSSLNAKDRGFLIWMAPRLVETRRVLAETGSLYLHSCPRVSGYLRLLLDALFGPDRFEAELVWKRASAHNSANRWGRVHDTIFFYTKSEEFTWNPVYWPYDEDYVERYYYREDERGRYRLDDLTARANGRGRRWEWKDHLPPEGRMWSYPEEELDRLDQEGLVECPERGEGVPRVKRYLSEAKGIPLQSVITDIPPLNANSGERTGYPTQKPVALLRRIIEASSNEGDVVLDPFFGSGTTLVASDELGRQWIGMDSSEAAIRTAEERLGVSRDPAEPARTSGRTRPPPSQQL